VIGEGHRKVRVRVARQSAKVFRDPRHILKLKFLEHFQVEIVLKFYLKQVEAEIGSRNGNVFEEEEILDKKNFYCVIL